MGDAKAGGGGGLDEGSLAQTLRRKGKGKAQTRYRRGQV
jgi:hypothetical protein